MNTLLEKAVNWFKSFDIEVNQTGDLLFVNIQGLKNVFGDLNNDQLWCDLRAELIREFNTRSFAWVGHKENCLKITVL